jgi:NAD(P)H dehydrogenase (quinone)
MTTSVPLIGVTGSTGQLGGRVATRLATLGQPQRLLVRNLARAPQLPGAQVVQAAYEDGPSMRAALSGIQTLFLVSGDGPARLEQHYSAIDAALAAGVERIVYTSFLAAAPRATFTHAREHHLTEQRIRATGRGYTFLRPSFYLDRAPGWFSREGVVRGPAGNGTISWVSRDDLADVAAAVLTTGGHAGRGRRRVLSCHGSASLLSARNPRGSQSGPGEAQSLGLAARGLGEYLRRHRHR